MTQSTHDHKTNLELVIDATSLRSVLEMLAEICHEKADHLASNWQDHTSARAWVKAAKTIHRCAESNAVSDVS